MGTLTYVDANVLINLFSDDKAKKEKALAVVSDKTREFLWSSCLKLEVEPKSILKGNQSEVAICEAFFNKARFVLTDETRIEEAFQIAATHGLSAMDALHIACAKSGNAAEFITFEKPTRPFFHIPPEELQVVSLYQAN
jgi:predicted nucleic acid-binding protein